MSTPSESPTWINELEVFANHPENHIPEYEECEFDEFGPMGSWVYHETLGPCLIVDQDVDDARQTGVMFPAALYDQPSTLKYVDPGSLYFDRDFEYPVLIDEDDDDYN